MVLKGFLPVAARLVTVAGALALFARNLPGTIAKGTLTG